MNRIAQISGGERSDIFAETAARKGLPEAIIEKDFWVCWVLKQLAYSDAVGRRTRPAAPCTACSRSRSRLRSPLGRSRRITAESCGRRASSSAHSFQEGPGSSSGSGGSEVTTAIVEVGLGWRPRLNPASAEPTGGTRLPDRRRHKPGVRSVEKHPPRAVVPGDVVGHSNTSTYSSAAVRTTVIRSGASMERSKATQNSRCASTSRRSRWACSDRPVRSCCAQAGHSSS